AEVGEFTSLLTENLSSARLIKTYALETYTSERVNRSFELLYKLRMKATSAKGRVDPLLEAFGGFAVAGVLAFAYWRISSGISTVGDFMGF
ncbi:ABC transporter transmembrane domain-containing protein, partial [Acinetobacter baumannii]